MDELEKFFNNNNLQDEENIDSLLECASVVRQLVSEKNYDNLNRVISYTIENSFYEAFM